MSIYVHYNPRFLFDDQSHMCSHRLASFLLEPHVRSYWIHKGNRHHIILKTQLRSLGFRKTNSGQNASTFFFASSARSGGFATTSCAPGLPFLGTATWTGSTCHKQWGMMAVQTLNRYWEKKLYWFEWFRPACGPFLFHPHPARCWLQGHLPRQPDHRLSLQPVRVEGEGCGYHVWMVVIIKSTYILD